MNPQQKIKPYRNRKYLDWIASLPCCMGPFNCQGDVVAHHVRRHYWGAGMGIKPHDYCTIPFCTAHHDSKFENEIDVNITIINNMARYLEKKYGVDAFKKNWRFKDLEKIDELINMIENNR